MLGIPPIQKLMSRVRQMPLQQQQQMMYWVGGLSPLATNLVTPIVTHYRLKMTNLPEEERRMNVVQEVARQVVSGGLQLASFFGGAWLMRQAGGKSSQTLVEFLAGVFLAFLSYAFIRPLISTEIVLRYLYPQAHRSDGKLSGGLKPPVLLSGLAGRLGDTASQGTGAPLDIAYRGQSSQERFTRYLQRIQA